MVFSSIAFLFFFLPVTIAVYHLAPRPARNAVLLAASLVFYTWGGGALVLILLGSIAGNYAIGWLVEREVDAGRRRRALAFLGAGAVLNVALLAWFKYATFVVGQLDALIQGAGGAALPALAIILPIGISFYTFHSLSYLIDIYRGTARHLANPIDFALYITLFPQLIAGPIVRFHEIRDQLTGRLETSHRFSRGVVRFAHGLGKKVLIADTVAPIADAAFATPTGELTAATAAIGVVAYAVQLYFDFSGYSDMALGIGGMFGFHLPENFDRPYGSRSVTEFWRRWHMSLSRWFRDYLYVPLGGNRGSTAATYRNLVIVFLATGIWHGANWTFLAWGAYHGALLLLERVRGIGRTIPGDDTPDPISQARTVLLVLAGWVLFRSPDIGHALGYLAAFGRLDATIVIDVARTMDPLATICLAAGAASVLVPRRWVTGRRLEGDDTPRGAVLRLAAVGLVLPLALVFAVGGDFSPFLYFQF